MRAAREIAAAKSKSVGDVISELARRGLNTHVQIVDVPGHHFWPDALAPTDAKAFTSAAATGR